MFKIKGKSPKELLKGLANSDEAMALAAAATTEVAMIRYPEVVRFLKQSVVYFHSNPLTPPTQQVLHAYQSHVSTTYIEIVTPLLVGGMAYAFSKFLRKKDE